MSHIALRSRRSLDGLPPQSSDEELIAWSRSLVSDDDAPPALAAHPRRREPLRAAARASKDISAAPADSFISAEEIFDEIRARVAARAS